jgi:signal peptidase I
MSPLLEPGERLLMDRLAFLRNSPELGQVVMVVHPERPELRMVKRLAGLPGDEVDGRALGRGEYWVLGDNADGSTDSRDFGPVRSRDVLGRAWMVYWPAERWRRL